MLLLLLLIAATTPGNGSIDLPPASDPAGRWIAAGVAVLIPALAIVKAKIEAKKNPSNGPTPLVATLQTPRLDVNEEYLKEYVKGLVEDRATFKAENRELKAQVIELVEDRATFKAENKALRIDVARMQGEMAELQGEMAELRGRLRGRGDA